MGVFIFVLSFILVVLLASVVSCMFLWRSSPLWPRTVHQLWIELLFQYYGFIAYVEDKLFQQKNVVVLNGKQKGLAIVTGGNRGIGVHVVNKLLHHGLSVVVAVRNPDRAKEELSRVIDVCKFEDQLQIKSLDISDLASIRQFAERMSSTIRKIDILIHNAGIMACPFKKSVDEFESQMVTNYLGPFLLTHLLMPRMRAAGTEEVKSRVILVSSVLHFAGQVPFKDFHCSKNYYPVEAYMNSKLCQVVIAKEWQRMFNRADWKLQAFSVHPGIVNTEIIQYLAKKRMWWRKNMCKLNINSWAMVIILHTTYSLQTPEEGSRSIFYAAISKDLNYVGGEYLSNCQITGAKSASDNLELGLKLFKFYCNMLKIETFGE